MQLIDGKSLANKIEVSVASEVEKLKQEKNIVPGLAVILIGDDPASHSYVKMKAKACEKVGFYSITHHMPDTISQSEIIATIKMMNENPRIDGILVQLPLPKHIDTDKILEVINPKKDVDGFHPYNVGRLVAGLDAFVACTPLGVTKMLEGVFASIGEISLLQNALDDAGVLYQNGDLRQDEQLEGDRPVALASKLIPAFAARYRTGAIQFRDNRLTVSGEVPSENDKNMMQRLLAANAQGVAYQNRQR